MPRDPHRPALSRDAHEALLVAAPRAEDRLTGARAHVAALALGALGAFAAVHARGARADDASVPTRVDATPSPAWLGQRIHLHGSVVVPPGTRVRFDPPDAGGPFTWSGLAARRVAGPAGDSVLADVDVQVFDTGHFTLPGLSFTLDPMPGGDVAGRARLPGVQIEILPTVSADDSTATLRPVRGLTAPWWERVPWLLVAGALALIALIVWLVRRLARRPARAPARVAPAARPAPDPASEALRALAALRAERLPEQGRFGEHALGLTRILRRFLEATVGTPRPGDTSGELLARLRDARLSSEDLERLESLLGLWDRVKFARAPLTPDEAERGERAVEGLVRRAQARAAGTAEAAA